MGTLNLLPPSVHHLLPRRVAQVVLFFLKRAYSRSESSLAEFLEVWEQAVPFIALLRLEYRASSLTHILDWTKVLTQRFWNTVLHRQ